MISETRIKMVQEGSKTRFYPQYKQVIIPRLWHEWYDIDDTVYGKRSLEEAKDCIDSFLWLEYCQNKAAKAEKPKKQITFIDYPGEF